MWQNMWQKMSEWLNPKQWLIRLAVTLEKRRKSKGKERYTKISLDLKITLAALSLVAIIIQVSC